MKKIISLMLVICMSIVFCLPVHAIEQNPDDSQSVLRIMPITKSASGLHLVSHGISSAQIHLTATVTINAQNGEVMNIDSVSAYQSGFAINFASWETTSISASKNSPSNGYVEFSVSGRITFAWTDPYGIAYSNTTNESFTITLNFN